VRLLARRRTSSVASEIAMLTVGPSVNVSTNAKKPEQPPADNLEARCAATYASRQGLRVWHTPGKRCFKVHAPGDSCGSSLDDIWLAGKPLARLGADLPDRLQALKTESRELGAIVPMV